MGKEERGDHGIIEKEKKIVVAVVLKSFHGNSATIELYLFAAGYAIDTRGPLKEVIGRELSHDFPSFPSFVAEVALEVSRMASLDCGSFVGTRIEVERYGRELETC